MGKEGGGRVVLATYFERIRKFLICLKQREKGNLAGALEGGSCAKGKSAGAGKNIHPKVSPASRLNFEFALKLFP